MNINRHTAQCIYQVIRQYLVKECERESRFEGEVKCDESYFGGRREGRRGRCTTSKVPAVGLLRRNGCVYTRIVSQDEQLTKVEAGTICQRGS